VGGYLVERRGEVGACRGGLMYRTTPKGNSKPLSPSYQASLPSYSIFIRLKYPLPLVGRIPIARRLYPMGTS